MENTTRTLRLYRCRETAAFKSNPEKKEFYIKKIKDGKSKKVKTERRETHGGSGLGGRGRKSA